MKDLQRISRTLKQPPTQRTHGMFLFWLSVSLPATMVLGLGRVNTNVLYAVNFAADVRGHKLIGRVIAETEGVSEDECQLQCVAESRCLSYNFGSAEDGRRFRCQLSDSDRFAAVDNFTQDDKFSYRGIQSPCEKSGSICDEKGICIPNYQDGSVRCKCKDGYRGPTCAIKPAEGCAELLRSGWNSSGLYTINPDGGSPIQVSCDMKTDGGGWTVFQRRLDGSVDFFLGWESYKNGFGNLGGEFWLGNDNLHRLTAADDVKLRVDLEDFDGDVVYAEYTTFKVADEVDKYRLLIGGYNGTAGDSMAGDFSLSNMQFSTKDSDNDKSSRDHCASRFKGAWWYKNCHRSNLNGIYHSGPHSSEADGICWVKFRGLQYSLKRTEMKLRPRIMEN